MNTNNWVSLKWELNPIEKAKINRDGLLTITWLTAWVVTSVLTAYLWLDVNVATALAPIVIFFYNYIVTYLCRKYNWLRVDNDGKIIVGNIEI